VKKLRDGASRHIWWKSIRERERAAGVLRQSHDWQRAQVAPALRQAADRQLERRIAANRVAVVGIGVPGADQRDA
jgi:hypothetical protein